HRRDLHWYLRQVEEALIVALADYGIAAGRSSGYTGVWTGNREADRFEPRRKIASIGVHARDWVTWHGFALNVSTELSFFDLIVPCGIAEVAMTSVQREIGHDVTLREVADEVVHATAEVFGLEARSIALAELETRVSISSAS